MPTITGRTAVLAILADPIVQARTPELANAALAAHGADAVLVPLQVDRGSLAAVIGGLRAVPSFRGAVVSMPNKTAILELLDDVTPEARLVGACNVLRRERDGRLVGTMLDGEGFVAGLRTAGRDVRGRRVFLAGAGGAASGIAFALAKHGVRRLTIHNHTVAKAHDLAARVRTAWPAVVVETGGSSPSGHDLVVNATSLGMRPDDALPLDVGGLDPAAVVAECVIHPDTTPLLAAAARRGCALHPGEAMLAAQIELMLDFMAIDPYPTPV